MKYVKLFAAGQVVLIALLTLNTSCNRKAMSTVIQDESKGLNGGFEYTQKGLPVNWQLYTAQTVPSGDFDVLVDTNNPQEGKQSLCFVVRECAATGGWQSPGIAKEMPAKPGEHYKVRFWAKNNGSRFVAHIGGISATKGSPEIMAQSGENTDGWKQYEYDYTLPEGMKALRFELNVLQPGRFWIDGVSIERF